MFAIAVLFVMLTGVQVYRNAAAESAESGDARIADAYLVSKIRQFDASVPGNSVRIGKSGSGEMLVLTENYDGVVLATCIYCADGYLRELYGLRDRRGRRYRPYDGDHRAEGGNRRMTGYEKRETEKEKTAGTRSVYGRKDRKGAAAQ